MDSRGEEPVGSQLGAVEILVERQAGFESEACSFEKSVGEEEVDASGPVDPGAASEVGIGRGDDGRGGDEVTVEAVDISPGRDGEAGGEAEERGGFPCAPDVADDGVAEGVALIVGSGANRADGLGAPREVVALAEVGAAEDEVPGAAADLHGVGQAGVADTGHEIGFIGGTGGGTNAEIEVNALAIGVVDFYEAGDFEVAEIARAGGEAQAIAPEVIHFIGYPGDHEHQGDVIGGRIHEAEHVHFHTHIGGGDEESLAPGCGGDDLLVGDFIGAEEVRLHVHIHEAMGEHDFSGFMRVVSHDADGGV